MAQPSRARPLLFLTGLAFELYGLFLMAPPTWSLWALFWLGLGLSLQIAGEGARQPSPGADSQASPWGGLATIRRRVQSWDRRE